MAGKKFDNDKLCIIKISEMEFTVQDAATAGRYTFANLNRDFNESLARVNRA
jgi:hypothetical protein